MLNSMFILSRTSLWRASASLTTNLRHLSTKPWQAPDVCSVHHSYYNYTSGRGLYNEKQRLSERHRFFDVHKLLAIITGSVGRSSEDVVRFTKLAEGGSYRVFETCFNDDRRVIARIPYPCTVPRGYGVASEVATIDYLCLHGIPTPKVLAWSSSSNNMLGSEYIIMEKARGQELEKTWYTMDSEERESFMKTIVDIESLLFRIQLPASGSLYYTDSLSEDVARIVLPGNKAFCIGPSAESLWWKNKRDTLKVDRGPWKLPRNAFDSVALRELEWLRKYGEPRYPREPLYREFYGKRKVDPRVQIQSQEQFLKLSPHIIPDQEYLNKPTIRHPDLSPSNIFVDQSGNITSIIDWERTAILPLFIQFKVPKHFQNFGDEVSENFERPVLPEDFSSLTEEEKQNELEKYRRRQIHYYYLGYTSANNGDHFRAMGSYIGTMKSRLYDVASQPWEGNNTSLKATLISAATYWPFLVSEHMKESDYPLSYPTKEVRECLEIDSEQKTADTQMQTLRDHFGINIDGWTPNEMYEEAKEKAEYVKAHMLDISETEEDKQDILENWPFQDHEEID